VTKFIGRRGTLGVAKEASRGVAVAPAYWIPNAKMSFFDNIESASESQGLGNIADEDSFYVTFTMGQGSVDAQLYDSALGYLLMSLLGAAPVTSGSNPYTHTFYTLPDKPSAVLINILERPRSFLYVSAGYRREP
jgi:hypothetical protein